MNFKNHFIMFNFDFITQLLLVAVSAINQGITEIEETEEGIM